MAATPSPTGTFQDDESKSAGERQTEAVVGVADEKMLVTESSADEKLPATSKEKDTGDGSEGDDDDNGGKKKKKKKEPAVAVHQLFRYGTKFDLLMTCAAALGSLCVGALLPVVMIIMGQFFRNLGDVFNNPEHLLDNTMSVILLFVYIGSAMMVVAYFAHALWVISGESQARRIRELYMHSILRQDMSWFDQAEDGSLTTRLATDTQMIQDGISEKLGLAIQMLTTAITGFIIAFVYGWRMALVNLATLPLLLGVGGATGYFWMKFTQQSQDVYADAGSIAEQVFAGLRTVYSFSLQERFAQKYEQKLEKACKTGIRRGIIFGLCLGLFICVLFCTYGLSFWWGAKLVGDQLMTGPDVLISFFSMIFGAMALLGAPPNISAISSACAAAHKIFSIIDRVPDIDPDSDEGLKPETIKGDIEFKNIDFFYPTRPDVQVLKNFSVKIEPGKTVALVGASGSGKSTAVQLLQRFYDPKSGSVLLDGKDLKEYNVTWLRRQIGVVSQEPVLFNMSIRKNLLMGSQRPVTEQEMVEACKKANCHNFITQLPKGYDTNVGEHGGMLSGGQKQRVAIARAIIKNPSILLLDEATSALDTQSERLVQHALDTASENRTTIVIAHRLSTIRNADLIVVMKQGEVVEQGTHEELVEKDGAYAELVRKQMIAMEEEGSATPEKAEDPIDDIEKPANALAKQITGDSVTGPVADTYVPLDKVISKASSIDPLELKLQRKEAERKQWEKTQAPFLKVLKEMRPEWGLMLVGLFGSLINATTFPASSLIMSRMITLLVQPGAVLASGPMDGSNLYSFLFLIIGIAAVIGLTLAIGCFETAGELYTKRLRAQMFRAYMKQEVGFFDEEEHSVGALTSTLALDAKNVNELLTKVASNFSEMVFTGIVGFVIAFVHSWILSLIILCMVPFLVAAAAYESAVDMGFEDDTKKMGIQTGEVAGEAIKEIRTVASLTKQEYFENKYSKALERPHKLARRKALLGSIGYAISQGIIAYTNAVAFYAGVRLIMDGKIDLNDMNTVLFVMMVTAQGIGRATTFASGIAKAKHSALSAFQLLERKPAIDPDLEGIEPSNVNGELTFENIAFTYPARPDVPIFTGDFGFKGEAGKTIALVGTSGCGKSTTIGMLQRWYDPSFGNVRLDEHKTQSFSLHNLRSHMAVVSQEPVLFDMSIGDNIRFGLEEGVQATQEQLEQVAKSANIHQFIESLPDGYDTRVGEKGSQLSGGQKQRIAIARAMIRNPRVLLLDEATSALDSESEKLVQTAIDNVLREGGRTTITIAHRLSTIQGADKICVIRKGRVIEQGTHFELLKLNGVYKELVQQQSLSTDQ